MKRQTPIFRVAYALALSSLLAGCAGPPGLPQARAIPPPAADATGPWTDIATAYDPQAVRFAVFSDLTGGEREGVFDVAVEQLNLLRPELVVNVGDLIEGGTDPAEINRQWDSFDARAGRASARIFLTGGNHDLLGREMRAVWEQRHGARYYHLRYRDLLFLILDTEDHSAARLNEIAQLRREAMQVVRESGWDAFEQTAYARLPEDETGMISSAQADYMRAALADNSEVRWTFLLMHKAPWANNDMPAWLAIEDALGDRPYTVFHGHRHSYRHQKRDGHDYIRLATTGGVFARQPAQAMDQLVWVTVDRDGAHIANLKMSGILDRTGRLPLNGDALCLQPEDCSR